MAFYWPPFCRNKLFCNPRSLEMFEPLRREYAAKLGLGELHVFSSALCPTDEVWFFDHNGKQTRLVWGERHSKSMATCGPRGMDANGSPVEAV